MSEAARAVDERDAGEGSPDVADVYRRGAYLVGAITLCSRASGVVRDAALATLLGASLLNDLFQLAFELPNLARRVAGDSALAPLALPLRRKLAREHGRDGVGALAWRGGAWFLAAGLLLAVVAAIAAPLVARAFLPAWGELSESAEGREIVGRAVALTRLTSLYFATLLAASFLSAMLQGERDFLLPALGGLPLNATLIVLCGGALWMFGPMRAESAADLLANDAAWTLLWTLGCGILAGGALRLALVAWGMWRIGYRRSNEAPALGGELRRLVKRAGPTLLVLAAPQLHVTIHLALVSWRASTSSVATFDPEGTLSLLRYAHRVMEFPLALVAGALAATTLPALLDDEHRPSAGAAKAEAGHLADSLRRFLFLGVPAAVGLAMLARPSVAALFQRGAWTADNSAACARYLAAYAWAMVPLGLCHIATPAGLAFAGARPMLRDAVASLALGTVASAALVVATGDPASLPFGMIPAEVWRLWATLRRARLAAPEAGAPEALALLRALAAPLAASGAMALALATLGAGLLPDDVVAAGGIGLASRLGGAICAGAACYFATAWIANVALKSARAR